MKFFGQSKVRRFGISEITGMVVVKEDKHKPRELCEIHGGGPSLREIRQRGEELAGKPFQQLSGRRHNADIIARTPEGKEVSTIQVENVYNDWLILNTVGGLGTYEHVANVHELAVLAIARKMFGS